MIEQYYILSVIIPFNYHCSRRFCGLISFGLRVVGRIATGAFITPLFLALYFMGSEGLFGILSSLFFKTLTVERLRCFASIGSLTAICYCAVVELAF